MTMSDCSEAEIIQVEQEITLESGNNTSNLFSLYNKRIEKSAARRAELDEVREASKNVNVLRVKRNERRIFFFKFSVFAIACAVIAVKFF